MKPKEWLYKNGHITKEEVNKRGRLSRVNVSLIEEAVANGAMIDGYSASKPTAQTPKESKVSRVKVDANRIPDVPDALRDERDFTAHVTVDGKTVEVGKRTVCNGCHSSLPYCGCPEPRVWIDHEREAVVRFKFTRPKE